MLYPKPCYNEPCYKEIVVYFVHRQVDLNLHILHMFRDMFSLEVAHIMNEKIKETICMKCQSPPFFFFRKN